MANAPYQQSRAALRREYGSRVIDASSKQSPLDTTPSGKMARFAQDPDTKKNVAGTYRQDWKKQFDPVLAAPDVQQPMQSRVAMQNPTINPIQKPFAQGGPATPEDLQSVIQSGGAGTFKTPYGGSATIKPLGLLPETAAPDTFTPFTTTGPLSSFALPKPTVLSSGSKWSRPAFG